MTAAFGQADDAPLRTAAVRLLQEWQRWTLLDQREESLPTASHADDHESRIESYWRRWVARQSRTSRGQEKLLAVAWHLALGGGTAGDPPLALELCEAIGAPRSTRLLSIRATALAALGEWVHAEGAVAEALQQAAGDPREDTAWLRELQRSIANRLLPQPPIPSLAQGLGIVPPRSQSRWHRVALAHHRVALAQWEQGHLAWAAESASMAAICAPEAAPVHLVLARLLHDSDPPTAQAHLAAAVLLGQHDPEVLARLAMVRHQQGRDAEAVWLYRRALQARPGWEIAANNLAWIYATCPLDSLRDARAAQRLIEPLLAGPSSASAEVLGTAAAIAAEDGRFDAARQLAQRAQAIAQRDGNTSLVAALRRQQLHYAAGRPYRGALPDEAASDRSLSHLDLGRALYGAQHFPDAAAHFAAALQGDEPAPQALLALGSALQQQGRHAEAVARFAQALRARPLWPEAVRSLAWLLAATGDPRLHDPNEAWIHLQALPADAGEDWTMRDTRAVVLAACGRYDEAAEAAQAALDLLRPSSDRQPLEIVVQRLAECRAGRAFRLPPEASPPAEETHYALAFGALGALAAHQGRPEAARDWFARAVQAQPDHPRWHNELGMAEMLTGRLREAARHFRKAWRMAPQRPMFANNLAWVLATDREATAADRAEALALAESNAAADRSAEHLDTLAVACAAVGRFDRARAAAQEAHQLAGQHRNAALADEIRQRLDGFARGQPYHPPLRPALRFDPAYQLLHLRLGMECAEAGDDDTAVCHYLGVLRHTEHPAVQYALGNALRRLGRLDEALKHYEAAARLWPEWVPALNNHAWLLAARPWATADDGRRAVDVARKACEATAWVHVTALDTLAVAHARAGDFSAAASVARRAVRMAEAGGGEPLAAEIRARLRLFQRGQPYCELPIEPRPTR